MTPQQIFEDQIARRLSDPAQQASAKEIDAIYQFHVTGDNGGDWVVDLQACEVSNGTNADAHCTITMDAGLCLLINRYKRCRRWWRDGPVRGRVRERRLRAET